MSQSDPNVANGAGLSVRTGLVNALLAVLSTHSGTVDPTYKVAGMQWYRTDVPGTGVWTKYEWDGAQAIVLGTLNTTTHKWTPAAVPSVTADVFLGTGANGINNQSGTTYTLVAADNGKIVTMNNASANSLTVPTGLGAGFACAVVQLGAGLTTIVQGTSATLRARNGLKLGGQYAQAGLLWLATDTYSVGGDTTP
jgi:hypothetical protein